MYAIRLGLEGGRKVESDLNSVSGQIDRVSGSLRRAAQWAAGLAGITVGVAAIRSASREWVDYAAEAQRSARLTGIATESFTALAHAAKRSDMDVATLTRGLWRLNQSMVRAQREGGQHQKIFDVLGVSITDTEGKIRSADAVLLDLADRFAAIPDPAMKAEAATRIFGERAGERIPELMQNGRAGIEGFIREAERLNLVISEESAQAASEFGDHMDRLKDAATGLANRFLPPLIDAINALNRAMGNTPASAGLTVADLIEEDIKETQDRIEGLRRDLATFGTSDNILSILGFGSREEIRQEIDSLESELARLQESLQVQREIRASAASASAVDGGNLAGALAGGSGSASGTGSGGGGEKDPDERTIARLYESTRTPQEQFMARMDEIGRLYREGKIDLDLYNRAALSYVDALGEMGSAAEEVSASESLRAFERLEESLLTQEEALAASYQRRAEIVGEALAQGEISQQRAYETLLALEQEYQDGRAKIALRAEDQIATVREGAIFNAVQLLRIFGQENKAAAVLAIAVTRGLAMAQTWAHTQTAAMLAYSSQLVPGDPTSIARAEAARAATLAMGKVSMGLIMAAAAVEGISAIKGGSGGGSVGSGAGPVFPADPVTAQPERRDPQRTVQVIFQGNAWYGYDDYAVEQIMDGISRAIKESDRVLITRNSRQAQELTGG